MNTNTCKRWCRTAAFVATAFVSTLGLAQLSSAHAATHNSAQQQAIAAAHVSGGILANRDVVETRVDAPLQPLPPAPPASPEPDGPVQPPVPPVVPPAPPPGPAGTTLALQKRAAPKRVVLGGAVTYRVVVSNRAGVTASNAPAVAAEAPFRLVPGAPLPSVTV